jgi:hypothetical protein
MEEYMVRSNGKITFSPEEQAVLDAFDGTPEPTVVSVVHGASTKQPSSSVRSAYWALVSNGVIEVSSSGRVNRA